jgi:hypothetical protein
MWVELLPNPTVMNDPTYFPPKYFAQLFTSLGETQFRLFISAEAIGGDNAAEPTAAGSAVRLLMELDDSIAPSAVEYARTLLKADVNQCEPPALNYKYRLEATLAKPCAFPISYVTRQWIDRYAPSSQSQMHAPVPADSLFTSILTRGTAVEIVARASQRAAREVSSYVAKMQRGKKMKEGLPIPGGDLIDRAGDLIYDGGAAKQTTKYVEPAKDKKLDAASEKVLSTIFECNVFVYGDSEEDVKLTLSSFVNTSMNSLRTHSIKRIRAPSTVVETKKAGDNRGNSAGEERTSNEDENGDGRSKSNSNGKDNDNSNDNGKDNSKSKDNSNIGSEGGYAGAEKQEGKEDKEKEEDGAKEEEDEDDEGEAGEGKEEEEAEDEITFSDISEGCLGHADAGKRGKSPLWKFRERVSGHWIGRHRMQLLKYVPAGTVLGTALVHMRLLLNEGITLAAIIRQGLDARVFAPEIAACGAAAALAALLLVIKDYRTVGLSEYELASIFSFPSPGIPVRTSVSAQKAGAVQELRDGSSSEGGVRWWFGHR